MSSNTETGPQFVEETQDRGGTNRLRDQRLVDLGFNIKACDFRQVISTENMEWGQSFWPRYVSVGNTMPFQGDDDASSRRMHHVWTFSGGPLYIVDDPEEEDE